MSVSRRIPKQGAARFIGTSAVRGATSGRSGSSPLAQCRTGGRDRRAKTAVALALTATLVARASPAGWPPFLPPPREFSAEVVESVERIWADPTLTRSVEGEPVAASLEAYRAFVDAPEVTAAAARHLGIARHRVHVRSDGWYEADDRDGARGRYRVLVRAGGRRVILSVGHHTSAFLGTVGGRALTVLRFEEREHGVVPRLTAYVRIENRAAALLARVLVPVFGRIADRKLAEGFQVTARVVEWAQRRPAEFCQWLAAGPADPDGVRDVAATLPACRARQVGATR
jgi:hypothetical protein